MAQTMQRATRRIWTSNFGNALFVLIVAVFAAYLPAAVVCAEYKIKNLGLYAGWLHGSEEIYLGTLAISMSAGLNYYETQFELNLGRICGALAALSVFAAILSLVGYFVAHFLSDEVVDPSHDNGWFGTWTAVLGIFGLMVSSGAILQGRRMKDNRTLDDKR
jgi:hypothetical protein